MNNKIFIKIALAVIFLSACTENKSINPIIIAQISSITPSSGKINDTITIFGNNFGDIGSFYYDGGYVSFNSTTASRYLSWGDTKIIVIVPPEAKSGKVYVSIKSKKSNEVDFTVTPIIYESVTIGTQVWMKTNLDVDHYRNGDQIPNIWDESVWANSKTGAWCMQDHNGTLAYGKLYNWYAVHDPRGLAPAGWHVASDAEWIKLIQYLGGDSVAGHTMIIPSAWSCFRATDSNSSGFSALAGGMLNINGSGYLTQLKLDGYWWTSTERNINNALYWGLSCGNLTNYKSDFEKSYGFSVRCVKD
ncbi:MAG: IPT/TIG domain-containing protein [Candidatus Kapabacteria bacterium]|nr:IPT/TIG domain-containing protein [Candidatus Kapabacteria bacterium]